MCVCVCVQCVCVECLTGERRCHHPAVNTAVARQLHTLTFLVLCTQSSARQKIGPFVVVTLFTRTSRRTPGTCPALSKPWWRACRDLWMVSRPWTHTHVHICTCDGIQLQSVAQSCFSSSSTDGKNQILLALLKCTGRVTCLCFIENISKIKTDKTQF